MKGIEISKEFYRQFGKPMLRTEFADIKDRIAVGLAGEGSECLGFDDGISADHDFDAGFCLFVTAEDEKLFGFRLERAYSKLPKEFMGLKRPPLSPVGGNRHGVIIIEEFFKKFLGTEYAPKTNLQWLYIPTASLACASGGEVFEDNLGKFSAIRDELKKGYPDDVRLKKLAAHTIMMAQSGQYNYERCVRHGEYGAAGLAAYEFVKHTISVVYLLNNRYEPFYKWAYRGMRELPVLSELEPALSGICEFGNSEKDAADKLEIIEAIACTVIDEFNRQELTKAICTDLEKHAYSIADRIKDSELRNMHIMEGI